MWEYRSSSPVIFDFETSSSRPPAPFEQLGRLVASSHQRVCGSLATSFCSPVAYRKQALQALVTEEALLDHVETAPLGGGYVALTCVDAGIEIRPSRW